MEHEAAYVSGVVRVVFLGEGLGRQAEEEVMRMLAKEPWAQCYQVLREAGCHGDETGLTASDLAARCNGRYGARHQGYWGKQLQALAEMGYAEKSGRWFKQAPIWIASGPEEQR